MVGYVAEGRCSGCPLALGSDGSRKEVSHFEGGLCEYMGVKGDRSAGASSDVPSVVVGTGTFEEFYRQNLRRLVGLAYSVSGIRADAEDLAQEAMSVAHRDWERISRLEKPEAWVRRILLNKAVSRRRRWSAERRAILRLGGDGEVSGFEAVSDEADRVWSEIRRLPRRQVEVVALRFVDDLTLEEIGAVLGCSKETVNTHLRRARKTLARRLGLEVDV